MRTINVYYDIFEGDKNAEYAINELKKAGLKSFFSIPRSAKKGSVPQLTVNVHENSEGFNKAISFSLKPIFNKDLK